MCNLTSSQIIHYTRWITQESKTTNELAGPTSAALRPGNTASFKKCRNGSETLATLFLIGPAQDLNLRLAAREKRITAWPYGRLNRQAKSQVAI